MADAGWYPDAHDPNSQHYFDGQDWTGHRRPNPAGATDETIRRGDLPSESATQQWAPQQPAHQPTQQWTPQQDPYQYQQDPYQQQQDPYQQQQPWTPPADNLPAGPQRSRKRTPIIVAAVAAVVVAAGLITFLVWPDDEPSLTFEGKEISAAADTLTKGEQAVAKVVSDRHGAKSGDTRCYFAKPKKAASGAKASDIDSSLRCGPVLFVDGERRSAYLSVPITGQADGSKVSLDVPDDLGTRDPAAVDDRFDLVRPDGKTAPTANDGAGDLQVPKPPAGDKDLLITGALGTSAKPTEVDTSVTGRNRKVTLDSVAEIDRYGVGDDARSAPDGQRLVAFRVSYGAGDVDSSGSEPATLVVSGGSPRDIPDTSGENYVIAAVPTSGTAAIVLTDGGITQSIALPSGKPAANTVAVLQRTTRAVPLSRKFNVPIALKRGSQRGSVTFKATASAASLDFWAAANPSVRASNPANALLAVRVNYTSSIEKGKTFGFDPKFLTLQAGGKTYKARNVAPSGKIANVFEVPASFTTGTLKISGSIKVGSITLTVKTPKTISISIPR